MVRDDTITLEELALSVGVTARAIRYYLTTGLLRRPPKVGRQLRFGPADVQRLRAIRELQRNGLSLEAIARQLEQLPRLAANVPREVRHPLPEATPLYLGRALDASTERVATISLGKRRGPEKPGKEEPWMRVIVSPEVEIQYRAEGGAALMEAVRDIASYARRLLGDRA